MNVQTLLRRLLWRAMARRTLMYRTEEFEMVETERARKLEALERP